jgi:RNA polymerase sigma-70 factor, ECF subfamily
MSVMIRENPGVHRDETLTAAWPTRAVRDPPRFDAGRLRMTRVNDNPTQPAPRHERRDVRCEDHWDNQFAELVGPTLGQLHRLAWRILRSEDLAEDAVQEALLSLWREGQRPPNPEAWLSRTVIHRSLHLNRGRRRRDRHERQACLHRPEFDPCGEPSRAAEAGEINASIDQALSGLPERLRTVFVLREIEQLDYESIAAALRIPLGTVRSRLARSREALQQALRHDDRP